MIEIHSLTINIHYFISQNDHESDREFECMKIPNDMNVFFIFFLKKKLTNDR